MMTEPVEDITSCWTYIVYGKLSIQGQCVQGNQSLDTSGIERQFSDWASTNEWDIEAQEE